MSKAISKIISKSSLLVNLVHLLIIFYTLIPISGCLVLG
jgi:hypothetical protein